MSKEYSDQSKDKGAGELVQQAISRMSLRSIDIRARTKELEVISIDLGK